MGNINERLGWSVCGTFPSFFSFPSNEMERLWESRWRGREESGAHLAFRAATVASRLKGKCRGGHTTTETS